MRQPMLAATIKDEHLPKIEAMLAQEPLACSIKWDGYRAVGKGGEARSRTMKLMPNKFIQQFFKEHAHELEGLDGELMVPEGTFQDTGSALTTHNSEPDFVYRVFDLWNFPDMPFMDRANAILDSGIVHRIPRIEIVEQRIISNMDEFLEYEEEILLMGHEGIMPRRLGGKYKYGRSTLTEGYLMKRKPFEEDTARIVGFEEAKTNTNEATKDERGYTKRSHAKAGKVGKGTLGVILAEHKEFGIIRIGGGPGWTQKLRDEIWNNQPKYLGLYIDFKYQRVGTKDKPRSGQYLRIRQSFDI